MPIIGKYKRNLEDDRSARIRLSGDCGRARVAPSRKRDIVTNISDRDLKFMRTAVALAGIWSKDPSTKVCAVAVGESPNLVAWGYNGFPPGIIDSPERLADRSTKLKLTRHAEPNALSNATFPVVTLYVTRHPCSRCAIDILARRTVKRIVYLYDAEFHARWRDELHDALELFEEAGIILDSVDVADL